MKVEVYNTFCASFAASSYVVQWGGAHVWKVAGKVFAIGSMQDGGELAVTFKASKIAFEVLKFEPGLRPAPYLASRGMSWIQRYEASSMDDEVLKEHIDASYWLVVEGLPRKLRQQISPE